MIKRRTLAKQICDAGRVSINGRTAKAAAGVDVGDELTIRYGNKTVTVAVRKILEHPRRDEALELYEVLSSEAKQEVESAYVDDEEA